MLIPSDHGWLFTVDTRSLRYFQAVAELGNVSRASEVLRISQPALSRHVRRLEAQLGKPLFTRRGHGVTLTEAGHRLSQRAQVILRQLQQAAAEVKDGREEPSGVLTIAVPPAAGIFLVPALAERFRELYPQVFLKVVAGYSSYTRDWLMRGLVDLACLHDPQPQRGFETIPLVQEEVFLVGRPGILPKSAKYVRPEDLTGLSLILTSRPNASRRLLDSWAAGRGLSLDVRMEVDDTTLTRALLKQGAGFSLLTRGSFQSELQHGEFIALPLKPRAYWPLALVRSTTEPRSELAEKAVEQVRAIADELTRNGKWPGSTVIRKG